MEQSTVVREIQDRQTQVSRRLGQIQQQLYRLEENYLDATHFRGNVVKGWEGYLDFKPRSLHSSMAAKKDRRVRASDRIFSFASITSPIPKSELDKDEETPVALHWAEEYGKAALKTSAETEKATRTVSPTPSQNAATGKDSKTASGQSAKKQRKE